MSRSRVPEEEVVPRGQDTHQCNVRRGAGSEHEGKFVVIEVQTGDYEVSASDDEAFERAEGKHPEPVFFVLRVGPEEPLPATPDLPTPW